MYRFLMAAIVIAACAGTAFGQKPAPLPQNPSKEDLCQFAQGIAKADPVSGLYFSSMTATFDCEKMIFANTLEARADAMPSEISSIMRRMWQEAFCRKDFDQFVISGWTVSLDIEFKGKRLLPTTFASKCGEN